MDLIQQTVAIDPASHLLVAETLIGIALAYFASLDE